MSMKKLVYCATPSRLAHLADEITKYVSDLGFAPLHPFPALPRKFYEDGHIGRDGTMEICLGLVEFCPLFLLFGISEGTLLELKRAISLGKPIVLIDGFDSERDNFYENLKEKHANPLKELKWVSKENIEEVKLLLSPA